MSTIKEELSLVETKLKAVGNCLHLDPTGQDVEHLDWDVDRGKYNFSHLLFI